MKISTTLKFNGKLLKILAIQQEIPLWSLAHRSGIPLSRLSDYIHGRRIPSNDKIGRLAKSLGVVPEVLMEQINAS